MGVSKDKKKILAFTNYNSSCFIWFKFGILLGRIVSPIIMGVIFFLVVTPTSILLKIFGKDVLKLKYNNSKTYWLDKNEPKSKMKNQF